MTWTNKKFIKQHNVTPVKKTTYLSKNWVFAKPLSIMGSCRLREFKSACCELENLLESLNVVLTQFDYHAGEYSAALNLNFRLEDGATIEKHKRVIYWYLNKYLPVTRRQLDWMSDDYIHQCLSYFYTNTTEGYAHLRLVLDFDNTVIEYPSHDFLCMSEDLMHQQLAA